MRALLLLLAFFGLSAKAQQLTIHGTVADSATKKALEYITLSLKTEQNQVVKTGPTGQKGEIHSSRCYRTKKRKAELYFGPIEIYCHKFLGFHSYFTNEV